MATRSTSLTRIAYVALAWIFVAGILYQVFLVGLALLAGQPTWSTHVDTGHTLAVLPLLLLILSFFGRLPRSERWLAVLLFSVYVVQAEVFAAIRDAAPLVAALHPVLALVLFTIAVLVAHRAGNLVRQSKPPQADPRTRPGL